MLYILYILYNIYIYITIYIIYICSQKGKQYDLLVITNPAMVSWSLMHLGLLTSFIYISYTTIITTGNNKVVRKQKSILKKWSL